MARGTSGTSRRKKFTTWTTKRLARMNARSTRSSRLRTISRTPRSKRLTTTATTTATTVCPSSTWRRRRGCSEKYACRAPQRCAGVRSGTLAWTRGHGPFFALAFSKTVIRPANVLGVSCTARPACRSRSGAAVAANDVRRTRVANCNRRDAVPLPMMQPARPAGRSRAVPASHQSWAAFSDVGDLATP